MAVEAFSDKEVTVTAKLGWRTERNASPVRAGSYPFEAGEEGVTGWHNHDLHQLEYAFEGVAQVETATARYLLPPQQAVWIPAGVDHCTTLTRVRTVSVFFDPAFGIDAGQRVRVVAVSPLLREMILHARRWPIDGASSASTTREKSVADAFFVALGDLIEECLDAELPLRIPTSRHPLVAAAMGYTDADLAGVTIANLCAAVGTSERTLRRTFFSETGISWRQYLLESRLLRAMALLAEPGPSVLTVSMTVGFDSTSGFVRAFRRYTGETPLAYRRRVLAGRVPPRG